MSIWGKSDCRVVIVLEYVDIHGIYMLSLEFISVELSLFAYFFFASEIKSRVIEDRPTPEVYTSLPIQNLFQT